MVDDESCDTEVSGVWEVSAIALPVAEGARGVDEGVGVVREEFEVMTAPRCSRQRYVHDSLGKGDRGSRHREWADRGYAEMP